MPANWQSLQIDQNNTRITFFNPNEGATSRLTFDGDTEQLIFDPDIATADDERPWSREITGTFTQGGNVRTVVVEITTTGRDRRNNITFYNYEEEMKVRN